MHLAPRLKDEETILVFHFSQGRAGKAARWRNASRAPHPRGSAAPSHVPACAVHRTKNLPNSLESSPSLTFLKRNVGLPSLPQGRGALRTPARPISTADRLRFRGEKSSILCRRGAPSLGPLALCCGAAISCFSRRHDAHIHTNTRTHDPV